MNTRSGKRRAAPGHRGGRTHHLEPHLHLRARGELRRARERRAARSRRLRYTSNNREVEVPEVVENGYNIFLSHVWGTGQDQMRIVKQRLVEMLPDIRCFLDVDDLEEIGDLEGYIDRTSTVLVYCSNGALPALHV